MISVTLQFPSVAAAIAAMTKLGDGAAAPIPMQVASGQPAPAAAHEAADRTFGQFSKPAEAPAAPAPAPAAPTYDDVKAAVLALSAKKGRDAAAAVLKDLGVAKATELKPEQFAAAISACSTALAA